MKYKEINNLQELQNCLLKILKAFHRICIENNLRYSISFGTLLGAIRHKGFIPWDDDIDVVMPREDYERLLKLRYKDKKYEIKSYRYTKKYYYLFSKMIDLDTSVIEKYRSDKNMGVFIDIFPMDEVSMEQNIEEVIAKAKKDKLTMFKLGCNIVSTNNIKIKLPFLFIRRIIVSPFRRIITQRIEQTYMNLRMDKSLTCYTTGLVACIYDNDYFKSSIWDNLIEIPFEDTNVKAFKDYDSYLHKLYGNYMELPSIEKRTTTHNFRAFKIIQDD